MPKVVICLYWWGQNVANDPSKVQPLSPNLIAIIQDSPQDDKVQNERS